MKNIHKLISSIFDLALGSLTLFLIHDNWNTLAAIACIGLFFFAGMHFEEWFENRKEK